MNGLNSGDKTEREYSQMTCIDSGGHKSRSPQAVEAKSCEHRILLNYLSNLGEICRD